MTDRRGIGLPPITMRHGSPPANTDRVTRNDQSWRQLAALEFIRGRFDAIQNVVNQTRVVTCGDNLFRRFFLLEIEFQDRIKLVVRRQRLIVKLAGSKFR